MTTAKIPVQNVYYLLAYAWDHYRSGDEIDVDPTQCPDAHNLLALLLARGVRKLAQQGMDKGYQLVREATPRLRGRVDVPGSCRRMLHISGKMLCDFDELTANTLPNRILKSTCLRLAAAGAELSPANRQEIRQAMALLADIAPVSLEAQLFRRYQLHRNNRHYRLLMHVCQLLYELGLPTQESGGRRFRNILDDETVMHRVFEAFVRRFAARHIPDARVSAMTIRWEGSWGDDVEAVLPRMLSDVTIERPARKTIVDCKFYREALVSRHGRHRLHSPHLYQLMAYLNNKSRDAGWERVAGILLYPAVDHRLDLDFELLGHPVGVKSIDLDQPWAGIHARLVGILS
jgi:5-methylcytosine-specific restriction enzyme subunit McrC